MKQIICVLEYLFEVVKMPIKCSFTESSTLGQDRLQEGLDVLSISLYIHLLQRSYQAVIHSSVTFKTTIVQIKTNVIRFMPPTNKVKDKQELRVLLSGTSWIISLFFCISMITCPYFLLLLRKNLIIIMFFCI